MALQGSYQDHDIDIINRDLMYELQQNGSVLSNTATVKPVGGKQTMFDKTGKSTSTRKTQRNELREYSDPSFERRIITFSMVESAELIDPQDVLDMASDPKNDRLVNMAMELGRQKDKAIYNALRGSASVQLDGTSSTKSLLSANKIAVDKHFYDGNTGNTQLNTDKLKGALKLLGAGHVDITREPIFVIANMNQLMALSQENQVVSKDYRSKDALEIPGLWPALDGYLGLHFIHYEDIATDSSDNELIYVYPASAIYYGMRKDLTTYVGVDTTRKGNPDQIASWMDLGAARMYEEKVVEITCAASA